MKPIVIIDYGMGNLNSIANMIKKIGHHSVISSDLKTIEAAEKLILPGVGAFDFGMKNLRAAQFETLLNKKVVAEKTPILGICLGMKLLAMTSEEGVEKGLGMVDARFVRFAESPVFKVPHIGWSGVTPKQGNKLFEGMDDDLRFYFVHSYHAICNPDFEIATTEYGVTFCSAFQKENIFGVQFHPEKSHQYGMQLLKNFIEKI